MVLNLLIYRIGVMCKLLLHQSANQNHVIITFSYIIVTIAALIKDLLKVNTVIIHTICTCEDKDYTIHALIQLPIL